jgi:hypothetical protein
MESWLIHASMREPLHVARTRPTGTPAAGYPCGVPIPGFGMYPFLPGELLLSLTAALGQIPGTGIWLGFPVALGGPIPATPTIAGFHVYIQGAIVSPTLKVGLTEGMEIVLGT